MVRELYAGVDLPKLVQRMLVVMHEVTIACNLKVVFFGSVVTLVLKGLTSATRVSLAIQ